MEHPHVTGDHLRSYEPNPTQAIGQVQLSRGQRSPAVERGERTKRLLGLIGGPVLAVLVWFLLPADQMPDSARLTGAVAVLMGVWWMTEALPIPATALIPLIVFPIFEDGVKFDDVGASYGNNVIFLFMGGFLLALAMQRWNLHRRIALLTLKVMGTRPSAMVAGFMIATGFLSMWVSNTATAVMMLPIGVSVLTLVLNIGKEQTASASTADAEGQADSGQAAEEPGFGGEPGEPQDEAQREIIKSNFGTALMLGIAYAASIGSLATLIGTPPNTLLRGYMADTHGIEIGFGHWMLVGVPLAVVGLVICWFMLTQVLFRPEIKEIPGGRELIRHEMQKLGRMSRGEMRVLVIFVLAAAAWIGVPLIWGKEASISDAGIAIAVGVLLFLMPAGAKKGVRLLDWDTAVKLPWGVLLLFGGGLALSGQFTSSGLTEWIGQKAAGLEGIPVVLIVALVACLVLFLTELTSNTATAATFLPVAGGVAMGMGLEPMLLAIPVALAATCAFMLPVATPPNAIAYGSGYVTIGQMVKGGFWLNLIFLVLVTATTMTLAVWVFSL
ncbi:SLC13 family permease [Rothia kristinae]|uniref:Sodium-dependent dicarboxylate transporter SdcS n=1 Tax=Rothia kristinae TaxID=37923 RepID=A0A199NVA4_9MICC|nr:DASS family sodium-coupled anion symporter [Rothia kristinae]TDP54442.1 sodium-dependent dicarboxylate transporter 2/3/5 [Kocuria sp. AG109]SIL74141.1 anion transporter [Mycobacteroides abscessus subsp. abscessus]MCA1169738.1 DASS family sodium-coupled anion symporter [Rothia kristinae]OAX52548.1 carboxylate transporter [Rothia kristinae]QPT54535.1 DASS family sodium-coupled anion symporter [Rothia kristinae]